MIKALRPKTVCLMWNSYRSSQSGEWGSGAGKGGGSGGAVRDAGGSFGKMEAAREEEYFKKMQREQIKKLKGHLNEEISHHEEAIRQLQEDIDRHKKKIGDLNKDESSL